MTNNIFDAEADVLSALLDEEGSVFQLVGGSIFGDILTPTNEVDLSSFPESSVTIGTPTINTLTGTIAADVLIGLAGNDVISGQDGNDILSGGSGNDVVNGGIGDDFILGGRGNDLLNGGAGNDLILGGRGSDVVNGGTGDDTASGGAGNDSLNGNAGNDLLKGGAGNDVLNGGTGDDYLVGGAGNNRVNGGAGADLIVIGADGFNTVNGFRLDQGDQLALNGGLAVDDLSFVDSFVNNVGGTTISANGSNIAFLSKISAETVTANADAIFTTVAAESLAVSFADVSQPESIDFGADGSVTLTITNTSGHEFSGPFDLDLYISTDDNRDSVSDERNDGLLNTVNLDLTLAAGESTTVVVDYQNLTSVIAPGAYHLLAGVQGGELTSELVSASGADSVITWNAAALNAIQEFGETNPVGLAPTVGSRAMAILQNSVFNAVNAFEGTYDSYLGLDSGTPAEGASQDAAVAGASVTALASLFPGTEDLSDQLTAQLQKSLGLDATQVASLLAAAGIDLTPSVAGPNTIGPFVDPLLTELPTPSGTAEGVPQDILDGFLHGVNSASQLLEARSDDGFTGIFQGIDDPASFVAPEGSGFDQYVWNPELGNPLFPTTPFALSPGWGTLRTFSGVDIQDYYDDANIDTNNDGSLLEGRPFPNAIDPVVGGAQIQQYIREIEEVRRFGGLEDTEITDVIRSQDQTEIAIFWAYDRSDTFRPYGQLFQIAEEAAIRSGGSLVDNARTLALTSIALADSAITAWAAKYRELQPRPEDVISGDQGQFTPIAAIDGFDRTVADTDWQSLLPTPPFPDFLSGHSTFGGAFGGVLDTLFPNASNIEVVSQELVGNGVFTTNNNSLFDDVDFNFVRTLESYGEIGLEDAVSRVYGGVHVFEATEDARIVGNVIGEYVANNLLASATPNTLLG
jgi:hypothetical protein